MTPASRPGAPNCVAAWGGILTKSATIDYICIADAHAIGERKPTSDTLTVVSGRWAFCPSDAKGEGHQWQETEGLTIEVLRSGLPKRGLARLPAEDRSR
jgi:hypothetical protein